MKAFDQNSSQDRMAFLASVDLFSGLDETVLRQIANLLEFVAVGGGDCLMHQGDPGDSMFVLISGRLRATVQPDDGPPATVAELTRGDVVGEMALLTEEPRSASVHAVRDSELFKLSKSVFDSFVGRFPHATMEIARLGALRLRRTMQSPRLGNVTKTIAVLPGGRQSPLGHFCEFFAESLQEIGPTLHLNRERLNRFLGARPADRERECGSVAWLLEQETKYRFILYEAEPEDSDWTRRCLRQADHVLILGLGGSDPSVNDTERRIFSSLGRETRPRVDLVLLHPSETSSPNFTLGWLDERSVVSHQHLRWAEKADYQRLARFVSGRAVGLVLGGGGARALAHVGVIRALKEYGVPIDLVGGASMGAIIAAGPAMLLDPPSIQDQVRQYFSGKLLDFTLPFVSLISGKRISDGLRRGFGNRRIENLWLNYFCVSSDLGAAEIHVHREGALWEAVRSSISLPGVLPPVQQSGRLLVDGGLINNLPVDIMRRQCNGGLVIAVDIDSSVDLKTDLPLEPSVSGWRVLWNKCNPFHKLDDEHPRIGDLLMRSTLLGSSMTQASMKSEADFCLTISLDSVGLLDFKALDTTVESGYQQALAQLERWSNAAAMPEEVEDLAELEESERVEELRHLEPSV